MDQNIRTKNELAVMDRTGDTKTLWDPSNAAEVEVARNSFNTFRKKGYLIYSVAKDGEKGKQVNEFDPEAGKLIAIPPVVGG